MTEREPLPTEKENVYKAVYIGIFILCAIFMGIATLIKVRRIKD